MNFWDKVTGSDLTREMKGFELRASRLPADAQAAWEKIRQNLMACSDFSGRSIMPILDDVLGLLEESVMDGRPVQAVLGDDLEGFCSALASEAGVRSYRDKWRQKLNRDVARKLGK